MFPWPRPRGPWLLACGLAAALWGLGADPARAQGLEAFEKAREAYGNQEYGRAAERFEELVRGEVVGLQDGPLVLESRKYLAASYLFLGRRDAAEGQFEHLLREEPDYQLDPVTFPSEVYELFGSVRERLTEEREREEERRVREEAERRRHEAERLIRTQQRLAQLRELAATEVIEERNSRWLAMIPFGVGQFQNGHDRLGLTFAISEGLLLAASITTLLLHESLAADAATPLRIGGTADASQENRLLTFYRRTNLATGTVLAVLAVVGILDAQIRFRPVNRTRRPRELPSELREDADEPAGPPSAELELSLSPAGLTLRF